jgi:UbiD family decarboxylase
MEDEGPFCEHAGMTHGTLQQPIINVKCITARRNAIYYALQGGQPISESQPLDGFLWNWFCTRASKTSAALST